MVMVVSAESWWTASVIVALSAAPVCPSCTDLLLFPTLPLFLHPSRGERCLRLLLRAPRLV